MKLCRLTPEPLPSVFPTVSFQFQLAKLCYCAPGVHQRLCAHADRGSPRWTTDIPVCGEPQSNLIVAHHGETHGALRGEPWLTGACHGGTRS